MHTEEHSEISIPHCKFGSTLYSPGKHLNLEVSAKQHIFIQKHTVA